MTATPIARALKPSRLGARGKAFWSAMTKDGMPAADVVVLIVEACHMLDRLERLSAVIDGDGDSGEWARLVVKRDGDYADGAVAVELKLVINGAMSEARQLENQLRLLLAQIAKAEPPAKEGGSFLDELAQRRSDRAPTAPAV